MGDIFFGDSAIWFTVPALAGTFFFLLRLAAMLIGGGLDLHMDDGAGLDIDHGDSEGAFKVLSVQAVTAFMMGFGWFGLGAYRGWGLPVILSIPVGIGGGAGLTWLLAKLLGWIHRMQVSGTEAVGAALYEEGSVYVLVPGQRSGRGSVRIVVNENLRYFQAITDGSEIPVETPIRVTAVDDNNVLTVEPITREPLPGEQS